MPPRRGDGGDGGGNNGGRGAGSFKFPSAHAWLKFASLSVGILFVGAIAAGATIALYFNQLSEDLPDYEVLADYQPPVTTRVYGGDGSLVAEFARERRIFMPDEAMPPLVKQAFISAEDKKFYTHSGIDLKGIIRSQISNINNIRQGRRLEGGSTITQQVAKIFLLSSEQKIERKLKEWLIARRIERAFTKDQILELYLNEIYLGNRSYGVAAAALNYFDKPLEQLTVEEAAYLAAIPKGPSNYHPVNNRQRATDRRNWVIGRMLDDGIIDATTAEEAQSTPLSAKIAPPLGARDWASEYFAEEVRKEIAGRYGVEALYDGGLAVRTTIDPELQKVAGEALRKWLVEYDRRHGWRGPLGKMTVSDNWQTEFAAIVSSFSEARKIADDLAPWRPALVLEVEASAAKIGFDDDASGIISADDLAWVKQSDKDTALDATEVLSVGDVILVEESEIEGSYILRQVPAINGGLVAVDPHTGRVLAMVGGFSFQLSEFNRAVQAVRQPGSTFKPFVYAAALDNGYTPSSMVLDAPFVAPSIDSWYKPGNYIEGQYGGLSTLRRGIEKSRNAMTARLAQDLGIGKIVEYAERFSLSDNLPRELAISLGSGETTLVKITSAYSTFVNGGKQVQPFLIDRIQDRTGKTIYRHDQRDCPNCDAADWTDQREPVLRDSRDDVIDPRTAYQMVSMLEGVVRRGTGSAVRKVVDKPVAGKTGTTNDYKDAWFVGFAPDLAAGVFVGYDLPKSLGQGEAGGKVAAPIFGEFMSHALEDVAGIPFRVPSGIRLVRINADNGRPAGPSDRNVILEAFKSGDAFGKSAQIGEEDFAIDPLSSAGIEQVREEEIDELNGLY
ncbi:MAG: penicillin-binding protein 1A [Pseudomonadota bacterium]